MPSLLCYTMVSRIHRRNVSRCSSLRRDAIMAISSMYIRIVSLVGACSFMLRLLAASCRLMLFVGVYAQHCPNMRRR